MNITFLQIINLLYDFSLDFMNIITYNLEVSLLEKGG